MREQLSKELLRKKWNEWQQKQHVVGYVQMSDRPLKFFSPENTQIDSWDTLHREHAFIWEANLYDSKEYKSISVKHVGEEWFVHEVDSNVENEPNVECILHSYIASNNKQYSLKFKEVWQEQDDELCCGMKVLKPQYSIFVGVSKQK